MESEVHTWEIQQRASGDGGHSSSMGFVQMLESRVVGVDYGMQA